MAEGTGTAFAEAVGRTGFARFAAALVAGASLALAQPPVSFPVVLFLAWPVLFWLMRGAGSGWRAAGLGWAAGTGFFAATLFWVWEPFQVDPDLHGFLAPFAVGGMAGGLALFWAASFGIARALAHPGLRGVLAFACLVAAAEVARSYVLTGFPWVLQGYGWGATPVIQTTALWGIQGLSFLTLLVALLPVAGLPRIGRPGAIVVVVAVVAASWGWGAWRLAEPAPERAEPYLVRLVQPNMPQHLKWDPEWEAVFYQRHLELSAAEGEFGQPDAVVWSEAAVPLLLGHNPEHQAEMAAAAGAPLILGIVRVAFDEDEQPRWFNSLAVLGEGGESLAVYDKHHLVPFGEYIPLQGIIRRFGGPTIETLTRGGYEAGVGPHLVGTPEVPPFLPLICYEAIFPRHLWAPEGRAEWLVQVTNDAWFGTLSGPYQHYAQNRVRAIEQGLPLVRVANTGISAMIDPMGRELAALALGEMGFIDAYLPAPLESTLYSRVGDRPVYLTVAVVFVLTFINFSGGVSRSARP